jgi:hypothetical protein
MQGLPKLTQIGILGLNIYVYIAIWQSFSKLSNKLFLPEIRPPVCKYSALLAEVFWRYVEFSPKREKFTTNLHFRNPFFGSATLSASHPP